MNIFALLLAIGLGFGLSCLFFATLLSKSNDIGNSVGEASRYAARPRFERSVHRMSGVEEKAFAEKYISDEYFRDWEEVAKNEPASDKLIE